jgi:hypothetical protein
MSVKDQKGARRRMRLRYKLPPKLLLGEIIARERQQAVRENARKKAAK